MASIKLINGSPTSRNNVHTLVFHTMWRVRKTTLRGMRVRGQYARVVSIHTAGKQHRALLFLFLVLLLLVVLRLVLPSVNARVPARRGRSGISGAGFSTAADGPSLMPPALVNVIYFRRRVAAFPIGRCSAPYDSRVNGTPQFRPVPLPTADNRETPRRRPLSVTAFSITQVVYQFITSELIFRYNN